MNEIKVPTFDELVKTELQKFDEVIPKIEELKSEFLPLTIQSLEDKEGYDKVGKALRFVISKRTAVETKRKELKADSLAYGRAVDARAKEITELLSPIEEHLKSQKENVDNAIAELQKREEEERQRQIQLRHQRLIDAGMVLVGSIYQWYSQFDKDLVVTLLSINLETLPDDEFNEIVEEVDKLNKADKEKIEDEKQKLNALRESIEKQQKELQEQKELLKNQWKESKLNSLLALGCKLSEITGFIFFTDRSLLTIWELDAVETPEEWQKKLVQIKNRIAEIELEVIKRKEEQKLHDEEQEKIRKELAQELAEKKIEEDRKKAEEVERERISNLSDKEKITEYAKKLLAIEKPEFKTQKWSQEFRKLYLYIESFKNQ